MNQSSGNRTKLRKLMRERINSIQRGIADELGLPKGFMQFAKRNGALPEAIHNERLKYPS